MATVIRHKADDTGEKIGLAFGQGFSKGFEKERTKQENEEKAVRMSAMLDSLNQSGKATGRDALQVAAENAELFDNDQDKMMQFAQFYESSIKTGGKASAMEINVGGQNKTVLVTEEQKSGIATNPDMINSILGFAPEDDIALGSADHTPITSIFDKGGRRTGSVPTKDLDSGQYKLTKDEYTQEGLKNIVDIGTLGVKQEKEKREREEETGGFTPKTDVERDAIGQIERRGGTVDRTTVRKEVSILRATNNFSRRIARSLGAKVNDEGIAEGFTTEGDEARYDAAITVLPELMHQGLSDSRAFSAAKKISNDLAVGKDMKARKEVPKKTSDELLDEKFIKHVVVGSVYKVKDETTGEESYFVATGDKNNPYTEVKL